MTLLVMDSTHNFKSNRRFNDMSAQLNQLQQQTRRYHDALIFAGHEWSNQVTRLAMMTELLLHGADGPLTDQQRASIETIRAMVFGLERTARNYLDMAQVENDNFVVHPVLLNPVADVLQPLLQVLAHDLHARQQTYTIRTSLPDMLIWADPQLLTSVYENLISNAIKYGGIGGQIIVSINQRGTMDELSVWNSGPGILPKDLETIFDRFSRGSEPPKEKGHGIGLYLARRIIEAHGGHLWAESQAGAWANFVFTLPCRSGPMNQ